MKNILSALLFLPYLAFAQSIRITVPSTTVCLGSYTTFTAFDSGIYITYFHWKINGMSVGADTNVFITNAIASHDTITCLLTNFTGDTVFAVSNQLVITCQAMPHAGVITGVDSMCAGTTTHLFDTVSGGVWNVDYSNLTDSGGVVTGFYPRYSDYVDTIVADTIYYTVTNVCGSDTAIKQMVVLPLPDATVFFQSLSGLGPICVGQYYMLDGDDDGMAAPDVYTTNGNAVYDIYAIYGAYAGADTLISISTDYCGTDTALLSITVYNNPDPGGIVAPRSGICPGDSLTLIDTNFSGNFYWYSTDNNVIVNGNDGVVTGIIAGISTIYFTAGNQCGILSTSTILTVEPPWPIQDPGILCNGQSITLYDSAAGGIWSSENPAIAVIDSLTGVVADVLPGAVTISYRLPNGCATETTLTVYPGPQKMVTDTIICIGSQITLPITGNGVWSTNNASIVSMDNPNAGTISGVSKGFTTLGYTISDGCSDSISVRVVNCNNYVSVFPNPVHDQIVIQADTFFYNSFTLTNMLGQILIKQSIKQSITVVNTEVLVPGNYIIFITGDVDYSYYSKFVKE